MWLEAENKSVRFFHFQREANRSHVELVQLKNSISYPFHYGHYDTKA